MALSQNDIDMLNQMAQGLAGSGNIPWTQLLGFFPGDAVTPNPNTASQSAEEAAGVFTNPPFAGMNTLGAQEQLGYIQPGPGANLNNPDIGRVLPIQQLGQETLDNQKLQQSAADQSGFILGDSTQYHVPGYNAGNGSDVLTIAQMKQGLADWVPNTTLQALKPDQIAAAWAQLTGNQQPVLIPGSGQATLGNQENFAQQFGRLGNFGSGAQANSPLTLNAQNQYMNAILNAPKGPADAFSYLAKEQSMGNAYNPVAQLLGQGIQTATGQSLGSLANQPTLTNTQLASDLVNSQNGGTMSPLTQQFLSRSLQPNNAATGGSGGMSTPVYPGGNMGAGSNGTTVYGGTHFHLPTGFQTSVQDWNKLEPEAQGAFQDFLQTNGGQTPQDFEAGVKQGAPEFGKAAFGAVGNSAF